MNAVVVIETRFVFFELFPPVFSWSGMSPRQLTLPVQFWYENTRQIYPNFASVYAEYAVDWHRVLAISFLKYSSAEIAV